MVNNKTKGRHKHLASKITFNKEVRPLTRKFRKMKGTQRATKRKPCMTATVLAKDLCPGPVKPGLNNTDEDFSDAKRTNKQKCLFKNSW